MTGSDIKLLQDRAVKALQSAGAVGLEDWPTLFRLVRDLANLELPDGWEADALREAKNAAYWRKRAEKAEANSAVAMLRRLRERVTESRARTDAVDTSSLTQAQRLKLEGRSDGLGTVRLFIDEMIAEAEKPPTKTADGEDSHRGGDDVLRYFAGWFARYGGSGIHDSALAELCRRELKGEAK